MVIIKVFLFIYFLSIIYLLIREEVIIKHFKQNENIVIFQILIIIPIFNTVFVILDIHNIITTKYYVWKIKRLLKKVSNKIEDKDVKQQIKDLIN